MRTPKRFLATAVTLATVGLGLSACDASPYAATVGGQTITALTLNTKLAQWKANKAFVTADNASASSGGVAVTGSGSNTYTTGFSSGTLDTMVVDTIERQYLAAHGALPSPAMLAAARGIYESGASSNFWFGFPDALRASISASVADAAALLPSSAASASVKQAFAQVGSYLWTQVCVAQASAFDLAAAQALVTSGVPNGTPVCYDQDGLEDQPAAYRDAVFALGVGQVSKPIATSFGYQVVKETSRQSVPLDADTTKVLTYLLDRQNGVVEPSIAKLVLSARVKVNPAYGTWDPKQGSITPPTLKSS